MACLAGCFCFVRNALYICCCLQYKNWELSANYTCPLAQSCVTKEILVNYFITRLVAAYRNVFTGTNSVKTILCPFSSYQNHYCVWGQLA